MKQLDIAFEAGLHVQFPRFMECVRSSVSSCGRAHKVVAADLDMSNSELSRKLAENPNDPVNFPLAMFPELLASTGDLRPLYWLIERFLEDPQAKQRQAKAQLMALLPRIEQLLKASE